MTANQPGLVDEGGRQHVSDAFLEVMVFCADNHGPACPCRWGGEVVLPEVVIEANEGYVVVAEVAPDAR